MTDYERLEQAKSAVHQAESYYNSLQADSDPWVFDAAIYQLKSAELSLNKIIKEFKVKTKYKN
jgi:hypothetical protein